MRELKKVDLADVDDMVALGGLIERLLGVPRLVTLTGELERAVKRPVSA